MIFVIYWQHYGYIDNLFGRIDKLNLNISNKRIKQFIRFSWYITIFASVCCSIAGGFAVVMAQTDQNEKSLLDRGAQDNIFYIKYSPVITTVLSLYSFYIWISVLGFYVIICKLVLSQIDEFNKNLYIVFTFIMLCFNIPTSMFVLISLFIGIKNSWETLIFSIPVFFFSLLQLNALIILPAKVYAARRKVKHILYSIPSLWNPYNEKTYQIASTFINHVNEHDIGISLWGFAIVTKPLILTTLSLIVTYLTILIQMKESRNCNQQSVGVI